VTLNAATSITATFSPASTILPDLTIASVSVPSTVSLTAGFPVVFSVVNQGSVGASYPKFRIYLSRDTKRSTDDIEIFKRSWSCIAPKMTLSNAITETIPAGTTAGSYYLLLVIDAIGAIAESNEGNNTVVRAIAVR
jgi:subtilase family serine protease